MPSANGYAGKRAILYARVSTEEQARSGFSLAQQLEALRDHAAREGYEVLEEVSDPGQSGASLERPGMDRIRDLVASGGVGVVLAQDRDRFAREPAYHYLLSREFEEHGTKIRALNDRGDESPEGELTDGILDQLAKFERAKIAERTRRGKMRKAREGKVVATRKPPYGFRYTETRDGLVVYEPEMAVVERIFRLAAEGLGTSAIQRRLYNEKVPSPGGKGSWSRRSIKQLVMSDVYKPHTHREISELVSSGVAAGLDPAKEYGVRWWNRQARKTRQVSEPDGDGGRRYRKRNAVALRDRDEWIAVPVPSWLSRQLVDQARPMMAAHRAPERTRLARGWELRGTMRCRNCGVLMGTHTSTYNGGKKAYYYYKCHPGRDYKRGTCQQKHIRAEIVENAVWAFVSGLLRDPARIRAGMERLIEQERNGRNGDPEREAKGWAERVAECDHLRRRYQDQQAAGLMTLDELRERIGDLEETRRLALAELEALTRHEERVKGLERDRDALLESYAEALPAALEDLGPEERNRLYRMLRLEVTPSDGGYALSGAFCGSDFSR
jgi:site-specific DNA recombinase